MATFSKNDKLNLAGQSVVWVMSTIALYCTFQEDIKPQGYIPVLFGLHLILFLTQFFKKVHITLIYIFIILWTLLCIINWPAANLAIDSGIGDYGLALAAMGFAFSGWLMFVLNNRRW